MSARRGWKPTVKRNMKPTFHLDGTVSYWDVFLRCWQRREADNIRDSQLATMNEWERRRIAQHAAHPFR